MYAIIKRQKNAIVLLHEIYGINQHIKDVAMNLASYNYDIYCPDLLSNNGCFNYSEENIAYNYFINEVTIESALHKVQKIIEEISKDYQKIIVIGYSVGATIAWLCSTSKYCNGVIGFYGSRIRNYCHLEPLCSTLLFFAEKEKSFEVEELKRKLLKKEKVKIELFKGEHGFADRYGKCYDEASYKESYILLKNSLNSFKENGKK